MADWTFATGNALTQKKWRNEWWATARTESFFFDNGLVGPDPNNDIIVLFDDLEKDQGDTVTFGQVRELSGQGVTGDNTLEGNEEEPDTFDDAVTLNQKRNAVRDGGKLSSQLPADKRIRMWAKDLLGRWLAAMIDQDIYDALGTSPTKVIYGGDATTTATIESGDYMTLALVAQAVTYAKKTTPKIVGKSYGGGKRSHIVVMSPDQSFDIQQRDASWAQAQREAQQRGKDNPVFGKALGMHKDAMLFDHERVALATTWGAGANLNGATALFLGTSAGAIAFSQRKMSNEKTFDYGNKLGIMVGAIYGVTKAVFNSLDNAVIAMRTFRTNN